MAHEPVFESDLLGLLVTQAVNNESIPILCTKIEGHELTKASLVTAPNILSAASWLRPKVEGYLYNDDHLTFSKRTVDTESLHGQVKETYRMFSAAQFNEAKRLLGYPHLH